MGFSWGLYPGVAPGFFLFSNSWLSLLSGAGFYFPFYVRLQSYWTRVHQQDLIFILIIPAKAVSINTVTFLRFWGSGFSIQFLEGDNWA